MKNYYFLLISIFLFSVANAQIVNIPDVNFKNKLLMSSYTNEIALDQFGNSIRIDINNDGQIQNSELTIIRVLNLNDSSIANLTGIEAFPVLNKLNCQNNSLTSLNVSAFPYLTRLDCSNNKLTSLNVSGLEYLQTLYCFNNQLISLSLSGLKYLVTLNCYDNKLTSLNVSGLIYLQTLDCQSNKLTTLNVVGTIALNILRCNNNLLTSLNVSEHTKLYWVYCNDNLLTNLTFSNSVISFLYCDNNQLTSLNVSSLSNLIELYCSYNPLNSLIASGLTKLTIIKCNNGLLTSLDFSGTVSHIQLYCSHNKLTSTSGIYSGVNVLGYIDCSYNLFETFTFSSPFLGGLNITGNPLIVLNLSGCSNCYGVNDTLDVSHGKLTSLNLTDCKSLKIIKCNDNLLTSLVLTGTYLDELNCSNNLLTSLNVNGSNLYICGSGFSCGGLTTLDCSNNLLTSLTITGGIAKYYVTINCNQNQFSTLDFSTVPRIASLDFGNNPNLVSLNIKNGFKESALYFANTPALQHICEDASQVAEIQNAVALYGYTNCTVSSDCSLSTSNYDLISELKTYPNPVKTLLNLDINPEIEITSITIFNTLGQLVLAIHDAQKVRTVDVSGLVIGTYFMKINSDTVTVTRKFVKN